jgi:hypothetical protein
MAPFVVQTTHGLGTRNAFVGALRQEGGEDGFCFMVQSVIGCPISHNFVEAHRQDVEGGLCRESQMHHQILSLRLRFKILYRSLTHRP